MLHEVGRGKRECVNAYDGLKYSRVFCGRADKKGLGTRTGRKESTKTYEHKITVLLRNGTGGYGDGDDGR
jgi:hypothetical protein